MCGTKFAILADALVAGGRDVLAGAVYVAPTEFVLLLPTSIAKRGIANLKEIDDFLAEFDGLEQVGPHRSVLFGPLILKNTSAANVRIDTLAKKATDDNFRNIQSTGFPRFTLVAGASSDWVFRSFHLQPLGQRPIIYDPTLGGPRGLRGLRGRTGVMNADEADREVLEQFDVADDDEDEDEDEFEDTEGPVSWLRGRKKSDAMKILRTQLQSAKDDVKLAGKDLAKKQTAAAAVQFFEGKIAFQEYAEAAAAKKLERARFAKQKLGKLLSPGTDITFSEVLSVVAKKEELRKNLTDVTEFIETAAAPEFGDEEEEEDDDEDDDDDENNDEEYEPTFCGTDGNGENGDDGDAEDDEDYDATAAYHRGGDGEEEEGEEEGEEDGDDVDFF